MVLRGLYGGRDEKVSKITVYLKKSSACSVNYSNRPVLGANYWFLFAAWSFITHNSSLITPY